MDTRNCKKCGRLFGYVRSPFCSECTKELDEKFKQVKEYLWEHSGAGIAEVAGENEVSPSIIQYWLKEERLCFTESSKIGLTCERCGTSIPTGRYCTRCKSKMKQELQKVYAITPQEQEKQRDSSARMRFLGHNGDK